MNNQIENELDIIYQEMEDILDNDYLHIQQHLNQHSSSFFPNQQNFNKPINNQNKLEIQNLILYLKQKQNIAQNEQHSFLNQFKCQTIDFQTLYQVNENWKNISKNIAKIFEHYSKLFKSDQSSFMKEIKGLLEYRNIEMNLLQQIEESQIEDKAKLPQQLVDNISINRYNQQFLKICTQKLLQLIKEVDTNILVNDILVFSPSLSIKKNLKQKHFELEINQKQQKIQEFIQLITASQLKSEWQSIEISTIAECLLNIESRIQKCSDILYYEYDKISIKMKTFANIFEQLQSLNNPQFYLSPECLSTNNSSILNNLMNLLTIQNPNNFYTESSIKQILDQQICDISRTTLTKSQLIKHSELYKFILNNIEILKEIYCNKQLGIEYLKQQIEKLKYQFQQLLILKNNNKDKGKYKILI